MCLCMKQLHALLDRMCRDFEQLLVENVPSLKLLLRLRRRERSL